ncbi:hypothetical protein N7507_007406 [Penicillium longicatenatum]|nr:hypothetical protein N7507_007406 [Penicillium longicatenatum]
MPSRLDPALDSNNITAALRGAGIHKSRKPAFPLFTKRGSSSNRGGFKKHVKPTTQEFDSIKVTSNPPMMATKPIPPVASFKIASPQEFLAQAQPSSYASESATALSKVPSPLNSSAQPRKTTGTATALDVRNKAKKADLHLVSQSDTPTPSPRAPTQKNIVPRPKRVETLARKMEAMAREATPLPKKVEVTSPMLPIKISVKANLQDSDSKKKESQSTAGVLLHLVSTATATEEDSPATFSSPSMADLSGIEFPKEILDANVGPPSPSPVGRSANVKTIATMADNALYAKRLGELQKKIDKTISEMQKELQKEIDESVSEMQKELAEKLGFGGKFQAGSISLQSISVLPSIPKDKAAETLLEVGSSHAAKIHVASPLTNVAFPLPNVAPSTLNAVSLLSIASFSNLATANEPTTPPGKNFSEYRSPPPTSSSEESKERLYDAAEMNQSPRKSIGTEGIKGFETLKVSETSARVVYRGPVPIFKVPAVSQSSSQSAPPRTPSGGVESSIYAKPKIVGPLPMVFEKPTGGLSYEPVVLRNLNPINMTTKPVAPTGLPQFRLGASSSANVPTAVFPPAKPVATVVPAPKICEKPAGGLWYEPVAKPHPQFQLASSSPANKPTMLFPPAKPVATVGPAPYQASAGASANAPKEVTLPKTAEPISRVKILGPAPYQPKRK